MKRRSLAIALASTVIPLALAACSAQSTHEPSNDPSAPSGETTPLAGGWTITADGEPPVMPSDAQEAFESATQKLMGLAYVPVAYLGVTDQGQSLAYLCNATVISPDAQAQHKVLIVSQNADSTPKVSQILDFDLDSYTHHDAPDAQASLPPIDSQEASGSALPADAEKAFRTALEAAQNPGFEPLALLGTQIVAGTNYAILCKSESIDSEQPGELFVATVYVDLDSQAQLVSLCPLSAT